ncbi:hypothetical protein K2173_002904 [Erythroxylum novogranatense]|uniref:Autophagy-related protein 27 n=1 Tax=Erythroxylum novogranatense TaxID=1862640 RepID=A0AAV8TTM1_9ROSI|nr:hypothetical protein K2173_002904 [Erythroxylum novogranatense]
MILSRNLAQCFAVMLFIWVATLLRVGSVPVVCEHSFYDGAKLYNFSLASRLPTYPHGVVSEDGFYLVAANKTVLWFQLCDGMIFNHHPPRCLDCMDCGGPEHCGMECSALMGDNIGGYDVCKTIGYASSTVINVIENKNPSKGVVVKMSRKAPAGNCSLSVFVLCDSNGVQGPLSLEKLGTCDYATVLKHPSGCPTIISVHGTGWGWFSILILIILCLFGAYLLVGTVYRCFFLGIRGWDIIPNLEFWGGVPQRIQSSFASLVRKVRRSSEGHRSSYSAVNF